MTEKKFTLTPRISTVIPGPRANELIRRKSSSFNSTSPGRIAAHRASGPFIEDIDGNVFLDFGSNITAIGYNHPKIIAAIQDQINRLIGASASLTIPFIECAEKLKEMLPGELKGGKVSYTTTGSEAVDLAIRIARNFTKRRLIISFHGTHFGEGTSDCSRLAGDYRPRYKGGLVPLVSEIVFAPWPYCYRCPLGHSLENCNLMCVSYFEEIFQTFSPDDIAGIIVEGLPANSGILIPPPGYMEGLRSICDKYGIMFLVDEVYSGFGRTGKFLAVENWNVIPDIVCLGKAMGSGLPISAVAAKAEIINQCDFLGAGAQGSFSGNIASCTASIATIELIKEEGLLGKASRVGEYMKGRLDELAERYERIGDIRGIGLMIGLELVKDRYRKVPGTEEAQRVQQNALGRGLLISRVGRYGNVIRMSPHLVTTREQADTGLEILEDSLKSAIV